MGKFKTEVIAKTRRNHKYALRYLQKKCKDCGHKSSKPGRCVLCRGEMKHFKPLKEEM